MKFVKTLTVLLVILILIVAALVHQGGLAVEQTVLEETHYQALIESAGIGSILYDFMAEQFFLEVAAEVPEPFVPVVTRALLSVFDQPWVEAEALRLTGHMLAYIRGEDEPLALVLDLRAKNAELQANLLAALALVPDQLLILFGLNQDLIEVMAAELYSVLPLPEKFSLETVLAERGLAVDLWLSRVEQFRYYRPLYLYGPYLVYLCALILLLLLNGGKQTIKRFSFALISAALIFYIALQVGRDRLISVYERSSLAITLAAPETTSALLSRVFSDLIYIPLYFALAGIFLFLITKLFRKQSSIKTRKR